MTGFALELFCACVWDVHAASRPGVRSVVGYLARTAIAAARATTTPTPMAIIW